MKMSHDYMKETCAHLATCGYTLDEEEVSYGENEVGEQSIGFVYHLKNENTHFKLETLQHGSHEDRYYLEIVSFHEMKSFSFELDSWRYFDDRIEFKYYIHPETGLGLSFIISLS